MKKETKIKTHGFSFKILFDGETLETFETTIFILTFLKNDKNK
jgi:hypothetical protein